MRKKKTVGVFLIITALILMLLPVSEADAAVSASDFVIKSGKLTKYKGTAKTVTIPDTVEVIGVDAFGENKNIEKIIFSDSVKSIEAYSFWGCDNLKSVQLGKGMTMIDDFAFNNCGGLESIYIPSNVRSIGIQAFAYCTGLEDITIPPEVTDIYEDAFDGDYLLNIRCEVGSYADKYAKEFYERQKKMSIYGQPEQSGTDASQNGTGTGTGDGNQGSTPSEGGNSGNLWEVVGEEFGSTKVVANQAVVFMQNAKLPVFGKQDDTVGEGNKPASAPQTPEVTEPAEPEWCVTERSYYRDTELTQALIEDGTLEIAQFAYARSGIKSISFPAGLERIDYAAFYHCDNLKRVELPDSVVEVASKAFAHTPWVEDFKEGKDKTEGDFLVSGGVLVAYRGDADKVVVPEGVRVIAGEAFAGHEEIDTVVLPDSLQAIDGTAFKGCNPEHIEYSGSLIDQDLVEDLVSLESMSAAPVGAVGGISGRFVRWNWIPAIVMLLAGSYCLIGKVRYAV